MVTMQPELPMYTYTEFGAILCEIASNHFHTPSRNCSKDNGEERGALELVSELWCQYDM
jgi:hypothetical protein